MQVNGKFIGYGLGDQDTEVDKSVSATQRRLVFAYGKNSGATRRGLVVSGFFDEATRDSLAELQEYLNVQENMQLRTDGVADYKTRVRIRAYIPPQVGPKPQKYPIQGVFHNTNAFLAPDPMNSYVMATDSGANEGLRLMLPHTGPKVLIGYSMGGDTERKFLERWPANRRHEIVMSIGIGNPAQHAGPSLLGQDPPYDGISGVHTPTWVWDRQYDFWIEGDWYPSARPLLKFLYQVLTRAALTLDFAVYLFTQFPLEAMQVLMGIQPSSDPLAGALSGLAGLLTTGPAGVLGTLLNPLAIFAILPELIGLLFDSVKFLATQAHGKYADPAFALWDGMTAVDKAAALVREKVPNGATLVLFPGTWSMWNQLFQFDVAARLQH